MDRNVLLIIADDLGKHLGCYGDRVIKTPHIDALATSGHRFDLAFASTASCSGSRSTIYTGLHTHTNGLYGLQHSRHHFMAFDHVDSLPRMFDAAGYLTGIIGKIHVGPDHVFPWDIRWPTEPLDRNVKHIADQAKKFFDLASEQHKPFHLTIGFHDPHRDNTRGGFANRPDYPSVVNTTYDPNEIEVPDYLTDLPEVRKELAEYFRSISRLDQGVGMVLDTLDRSGKAESTLVIFVSDNGAPFVNSKTTTYDAGVCLPLIARQPGAQGRSSVNGMVSFIDILPTCLEYCGIEPVTKAGAPALQGRSFLPLLLEASTAPPDEWSQVFGSHTFHRVTEYYPTRFLRTPQYKYHRNVVWKIDFPFAADLKVSRSWDAMRKVKKDGAVILGSRPLKRYIRRKAEELYDLSKDPQEIDDLSGSAAHKELLRSMRSRLEAWQRDTEDPWLFRDGASVIGALYAYEEDGWNLPHRFDFDWANP